MEPMYDEITSLVESREIHDIRKVERFIPEVLMQKIIDGAWSPTPTIERRVGAVMLADISGYTKLTEQLSTSTGAGYEALVASLNRYFDKISEEIYAHGGDVVKFAGDALLVAFYTTDNQDDPLGQSINENNSEDVGCNYIARFNKFPEISQDVLNTLDSCLRCEASLSDEKATRQICASCNIVCCGACCSNEVYDEGRSCIRLACDHCFSASKTIRRVESKVGGVSHSPKQSTSSVHSPLNYQRVASAAKSGLSPQIQQRIINEYSVSMHLDKSERPPFLPDDASDECMVCKKVHFDKEKVERSRCGLCGSIACPSCLPHTVFDSGELPKKDDLVKNAGHESLDSDGVAAESHLFSQEDIRQYGTVKHVCSFCRSTSQKLNIHEGLKEVVLRCADCALRLVTSLDGFEGLRLHAGVGAGEVLNLSVGRGERWEMLLAGDSLAQMSKAAEAASAGEVCLSREVWALVASKCESSRVYDQESTTSTVAVASLSLPVEQSSSMVAPATVKSSSGVVKLLAVRQSVASVASLWRVIRWNSRNRDASWQVDPRYALSGFLHYVPRHIRPVLVAGSNLGHLALSELRTASVLFINLPNLGFSSVKRVNSEILKKKSSMFGLFKKGSGGSRREKGLMNDFNDIVVDEIIDDKEDIDGDDDGGGGGDSEELLEVMQTCMSTMQQQVELFEGTIRQFLMDDKGTTLIAVFGLSPSHENDPLLACSCAVGIQQELCGLGHSVKIGITTGKVFAGILGGPTRCEYSVVGATVNFSARLMSALVHPEKHDKAQEEIEANENETKEKETTKEVQKRASDDVKSKRVKSLVSSSVATATASAINEANKLKFKDINILVDEDTASRASAGGLLMVSMNSIRVKGKAEPIKVFTPSTSGKRKSGRYTFMSSSLYANKVLKGDDLSHLAQQRRLSVNLHVGSSVDEEEAEFRKQLLEKYGVELQQKLLGDQKACYDWLVGLLSSKESSFVAKLIGDVGFGKSLIVEKLFRFASTHRNHRRLGASANTLNESEEEKGGAVLSSEENEEDKDSRWAICHHSCRLVDRSSDFGVLLALTIQLLGHYQREKQILAESMLNDDDDNDSEGDNDSDDSDDDEEEEDVEEYEDERINIAGASISEVFEESISLRHEMELHDLLEDDVEEEEIASATSSSNTCTTESLGELKKVPSADSDSNNSHKVSSPSPKVSPTLKQLDPNKDPNSQKLKKREEKAVAKPSLLNSIDDSIDMMARNLIVGDGESIRKLLDKLLEAFTQLLKKSVLFFMDDAQWCDFKSFDSLNKTAAYLNHNGQIKKQERGSSSGSFHGRKSSHRLASFNSLSQQNGLLAVVYSQRPMPVTALRQFRPSSSRSIHAQSKILEKSLESLNKNESLKLIASILLEEMYKKIHFSDLDVSFETLSPPPPPPPSSLSQDDSQDETSFDDIPSSSSTAASSAVVPTSNRPYSPSFSFSNPLNNDPPSMHDQDGKESEMQKEDDENDDTTQDTSLNIISDAQKKQLANEAEKAAAEVLNFVFSKAAGVPLYTLEVVHDLLRKEVISITFPEPHDSAGNEGGGEDQGEQDSGSTNLNMATVSKEVIDTNNIEYITAEFEQVEVRDTSLIDEEGENDEDDQNEQGNNSFISEGLGSDSSLKNTCQKVLVKCEVMQHLLSISDDSPSSLEMIVGSKIDSLSVEDQWVARCASVLDHVHPAFDLNTLKQLLGTPSSSSPTSPSQESSSTATATTTSTTNATSVVMNPPPSSQNNFSSSSLSSKLFPPAPPAPMLKNDSGASDSSTDSSSFGLSPMQQLHKKKISKPLSPMESLNKSVTALVRENILSPPEIPSNEAGMVSGMMTGNSGGAGLGGGARLSFRNPLAAASSYGRIPLSQRAGLHRRAGSTLAEDCGFGGRGFTLPSTMNSGGSFYAGDVTAKKQARYRTGLSFSARDPIRGSGFGFSDANSEIRYFGAAAIGEKLGEELLHTVASKSDGGKLLCKNLASAAAHFLLGKEVWYSMKCWSGTLALSLHRFAFNDTLRVATLAIGALAALERFRANSSQTSANSNTSTNTSAVNPLLSSSDIHKGESGGFISKGVEQATNDVTKPPQKQQSMRSMLSSMLPTTSQSKDEGGDEDYDRIMKEKKDMEEDDEIFLMLLMLCRVIADSYFGKGEPSHAKPFLKLLLEACIEPSVNTSSPSSSSSSSSNHSHAAMKRMQTSRLLQFATQLLSDPTEDRLSTFIFDDEYSNNVPTTPTYNQFVPRMFSKSHIASQPQHRTLSNAVRPSTFNNDSTFSIPYVFGSDTTQKSTPPAWGLLKKAEISKYCSRIDAILRQKTNFNLNQKQQQQRERDEFLENNMDDLVKREQVRCMASLGRVYLEEGDMLSALLYSLDALEQDSQQLNQGSSYYVSDTKVNVLCLSTIALSSIVVFGSSGTKIGERCSGRAVAIAMTSSTKSLVALSDALLARCYCSLMLGNLTSALDDARRASDLLHVGKFVDHRRLLAVENATAQTLIIAGAVNEAGTVSTANEALDDIENKPVEEEAKSFNGAVGNGRARRPSMSKTTLSRFFLQQHGGDDVNGLSSTEIASWLINGFRLLDIDISDALDKATPKTAALSSSNQTPGLNSRSSSSSSMRVSSSLTNQMIDDGNIDMQHGQNQFDNSSGLSLLRDLFAGVKQLKHAAAIIQSKTSSKSSITNHMVAFPSKIIHAIEMLVVHNANLESPSNNILLGFAYIFAIEIVIACIGDDSVNEKSLLSPHGSSGGLSDERGRSGGRSARTGRTSSSSRRAPGGGNTLVNAVVRTFARARSQSPPRPRSSTRTFIHSASSANVRANQASRAAEATANHNASAPSMRSNSNEGIMTSNLSETRAVMDYSLPNSSVSSPEVAPPKPPPLSPSSPLNETQSSGQRASGQRQSSHSIAITSSSSLSSSLSSSFSSKASTLSPSSPDLMSPSTALDSSSTLPLAVPLLPAWYNSDLGLKNMFPEASRNHFKRLWSNRASTSGRASSGGGGASGGFGMSPQSSASSVSVEPIDGLFAALDNLLESFKIYASIFKIFTPARLRLSGTRHYLSGNKDAASTKWARALLIAQQKGTKMEEAKIQLESYLRLQHEQTTNQSSSVNGSGGKKSRARTQSNLSSSMSSYLDAAGAQPSRSSQASPGTRGRGVSNAVSETGLTASLNVWKDDPRVTSSIETLCDCGASGLVSSALKLTGSQGRVNAVIISEGPIETL